MQPPRVATLVKVAAGLLAARLAYRLGRLVYTVLTSVPPPEARADVCHDAIPPPDFKHQPLTEAATRAWLAAHAPELVDLVDRGNLVVLQPAAMLAQLLAQQAAAAGQQGADAADEGADAGFNLSADDVAQLLASPRLQACMGDPVPDVLVLVGTVHVAKQSGDDVTRVLKALQPSHVLLELCPPRMQAMLLDPFADPLHDLEPCPQRAAELATRKNRSALQVLEAALSSQGRDVLATCLSGLYANLEDQLSVSVGVEFLAARRALIELTAAANDAGDAAAAGGGGGDPRRGTWLARCSAADRSVSDTLSGLWGALGPWERLDFIGSILSGLLWKFDEDLIAQLANGDLVDSLLVELRDEYPNLLKPLLHDRNWVLGTNTWRRGQCSQGGPPVVAIVGKGHLPGITYVVQRLCEFAAKAGGHPVRLVPAQHEHEPAAA